MYDLMAKGRVVSGHNNNLRSERLLLVVDLSGTNTEIILKPHYLGLMTYDQRIQFVGLAVALGRRSHGFNKKLGFSEPMFRVYGSFADFDSGDPDAEVYAPHSTWCRLRKEYVVNESHPECKDLSEKLKL